MVALWCVYLLMGLTVINKRSHVGSSVLHPALQAFGLFGSRDGWDRGRDDQILHPSCLPRTSFLG
jgi:hypothetical protein